jgi:hypothetical protein
MIRHQQMAAGQFRENFPKFFFKESFMNQDNNDKIFYGFLVFFAVVIGSFGAFVMNVR